MLKVIASTQQARHDSKKSEDTVEEAVVEESDYIADEDFSSIRDDNDKSNDPDFKPSTSSIYNKLDLKPIAEVADRYGVTDQAAAAIATATLVAIGVLSGDDWLVITRHKMRRSRNNE